MSTLLMMVTMLIAAISVTLTQLQSTDIITIDGGATTQPPLVLPLTSDQVISRGGDKSCRWGTGQYTPCSRTCEGLRTRQVFCSCTLSNGDVVRATNDNCVRDDMRIKPIEERTCGQECPSASAPHTTVTEEPRECKLIECHDAGDCYDDECCLQVVIKNYKNHDKHGNHKHGNHKHGKRYSTGFYCFPLLQLDDFCDVEANLTCPCGKGLECRDDERQLSKSRKGSSGKHYERYYDKYRQRVVVTENDTCPTLYNKGPKRYKTSKKYKYANALCLPETSLTSNTSVRNTTQGAVGGERTCWWETGLFSNCSATCDGVATRDVFCICNVSSGEVRATEDNCERDSILDRPTQTQACSLRAECPSTSQTQHNSSCRHNPCQTDSDCRDDECCLEAEFKQGKKKIALNVCVSQIDEDGACDPTGNWTCPCKNGLQCTENKKGKSKSKSYSSYAKHFKHYRPKIVSVDGDECSVLEFPRKHKHHKHTPTCQRPSSGRQRRTTSTKEERKPAVVFVTHSD